MAGFFFRGALGFFASVPVPFTAASAAASTSGPAAAALRASLSVAAGGGAAESSLFSAVAFTRRWHTLAAFAFLPRSLTASASGMCGMRAASASAVLLAGRLLRCRCPDGGSKRCSGRLL